MVALDANVLVRFLVRDDRAQARSAKELIDRLEEDDERGYVSDVVLCELVWVLGRSYGFERARIAETLKRLTMARQLQFDAVDRVLRALLAYERGRADFADYVIREHAKAAGCDEVATFDGRRLREEMFSMP